jgi:hypothetical protein
MNIEHWLQIGGLDSLYQSHYAMQECIYGMIVVLSLIGLDNLHEEIKSLQLFQLRAHHHHIRILNPPLE